MTSHAYDSLFMQYTSRSSAHTADVVTRALAPMLGVRSVLDVGCATGTWLRVWLAQGVDDVLGVDGDYVDQSSLEIEPRQFLARNLSEPLDVGRRFDLVQCLEVAEHLPFETSAALIDSLTRHADRYVLFSAAPPGQGGEFHINEQTYDFWRRHFERNGFVAYDAVRPLIANDAAVSFWYRYNIILYVRDSETTGLPKSVMATAVRQGSDIADVSPLSFRLRKALVVLLPRPVQNVIARTKAGLFSFITSRAGASGPR